MEWPVGFSTTKQYVAETENPDGSKEASSVHGGPFYFNPNFLGLFYIYAGFRPTPVWSSGYGDEGLFSPVARLLKKSGWGNLGFAIRRPK